MFKLVNIEKLLFKIHFYNEKVKLLLTIPDTVCEEINIV